ncbi:MAG: MBL fold metallo-hydrolase [Kiritimatiellia bacterium]|nr:MBL fold metallo-hydrolase [Kiritimatiellia bacterium]
MKIQTLPVGAFESNCYILESGDASLIIDPGADADRILHELKGPPVAFLLTHGHIDHLSALPQLCAAWPEVPVYLHAADLAWAFGPLNGLPPYYEALGRPPEQARALPELRWSAGPFAFEILSTPGHSPGGVCFYDEKALALFTGDTLFEGTVGRTDLPVSDARALSDSLLQLARLPPETNVHPGHGNATTIGRELKNNFFLAAAARRNTAGG